MLENKFSYMNHLIDLRLESLYAQLDELTQKLLSTVSTFERRIIKSRRRRKCSFAVRKPSKFITNKIGFIYTEFYLEDTSETVHPDYDNDSISEWLKNILF